MAAAAARIVVAYDGSDAALRALDRAAELAGYGSTVTVVGMTRELLEEARARLVRRHVRASTREAVGDAGRALVAAAAELEADLLLVGRAADRGLGPVAARVLADAPCDVLLVD